jgi:hypothetical protein
MTKGAASIRSLCDREADHYTDVIAGASLQADVRKAAGIPKLLSISRWTVFSS